MSQNPNNQDSVESNKRSENKISPADENYVMHKKDQIKEAVRKGNDAKAQRHVVEIIQYLGKGDNEMPIEDGLDPLE